MKPKLTKLITLAFAAGAFKEAHRLIEQLPTDHLDKRPSWNQRKARKLRRQRHAAGDKFAFAR